MQYVEIIEGLFEERHIDRANILDLACGTGTLVLALVKRGHTCFGIDRSPEMIAIARDKAREYSGISFEVQEMQNLQVHDRFDLVSCTFDSMNYLTDLNDVRKMFKSTAAVLNSGGLFIFDTNTKHMYRNNDRFAHVYEFGKESLVQRMHYDPKSNLAETVFEFQDGDREIHLQRPYGLKELKPLLRHAGFSTVSIQSGFKGENYTMKSERLICVAELLRCRVAALQSCCIDELLR
jgi:ubiquinone/menaquinone biosynthesis C-methylase UbiE